MDTPGVVPYQVGRKLKAPKSFLTGPHRSLMEAELVVVVVDASDKRTRERLNPQLVQTLSRYSHVPAVLLLNKVDAVRQKHVLLNITEGITEAAKKCVQEQERKGSEENSQRTQNVHTSAEEATVYCRKEETKMGAVESFREVFMVSALTGDGIEDLRVMLMESGHPLLPWS
jgi:GTPase Era involved in 16S rRNA processing